MYYTSRFLGKVYDSVITDWQPFIAPDLFTLPTQYADFGMTVNIYEKYKAYNDVNKKVIINFDETQNTFLRSSVGYTYFWSEMLNGVENTGVGVGNVFTAGSTNRYVIVLTDFNVFNLDEFYFLGAIGMYIGKNVTVTKGGNPNIFLKYVFCEDLQTITIGEYSADYINCTNLRGTLTLPHKSIIALPNTFRGCALIDKVIVPSTYTDLGNYTFFGAVSNRHYYIYTDTAPIVANRTFFSNTNCFLHIKADATGFDTTEWVFAGRFTIIRDL